MDSPQQTPFPHSVEFAAKDSSRFQRVLAMVGTDNVYTVLPSTLLEMLGVTPQWEAPFTFPLGSWENLPMAEVLVRIGVQERTTVCVFGKADEQPVLGRHTLTAFGLAADHETKLLVAANLFLA